MRYAFRAALAATSLALILGCGGSDTPKKVTLKGKLTDGQNPFVLDASKLKLPPGATGLPPGSRLIQITFTPVEAGETAPATVDDSNGTFTVSLAPGQYKIAVTASAGMGSPDFFNGKFSTEKTQIKRDVKAGDEIVIDITKPQG